MTDAAYHRDYLNRGDNRARHNARCRATYARDKKRIGKAATHRKRYGETLEETEARFAAQGHACAACGSKEPRSKTGWHTDHNHKTGKVRGVLCAPCNTALGHARDDQKRLYQLIRYLERTDGPHEPNPA